MFHRRRKTKKNSVANYSLIHNRNDNAEEKDAATREGRRIRRGSEREGEKEGDASSRRSIIFQLQLQA